MVLILRLADFVRLFFTHAGVAITQEEIKVAHEGSNPDPRKQWIPKIVHQVFHNWREPGNETLPEDSEGGRGTCMERNGDWEFMVRDFICVVRSFGGSEECEGLG